MAKNNKKATTHKTSKAKASTAPKSVRTKKLERQLQISATKDKIKQLKKQLPKRKNAGKR